MSGDSIETEFSGSDANSSELNREKEMVKIKRDSKFNEANRMYG